MIALQKERKIIIKACDKGAGLIVLDFKDYMWSCYNYLLSKNITNQSYYSQVDEFAVERAKIVINNTLKEGLDFNRISKREYDAMIAEEKSSGRFYSNLKVHKAHAHKKTPPVRPIVSGSGSMTEGIAKYVEHHIKDIAQTHETYLEDTPDFLRGLNKKN